MLYSTPFSNVIEVEFVSKKLSKFGSDVSKGINVKRKLSWPSIETDTSEISMVALMNESIMNSIWVDSF